MQMTPTKFGLLAVTLWVAAIVIQVSLLGAIIYGATKLVRMAWGE